MGKKGPQVIPLNKEAALALPVDGPNPSGDARWFPVAIPTDDNDVTAFINVLTEAYVEMGKVIALANGPADFIYLLAWDVGLTASLNGTQLGTLLQQASNTRGVAIRAMLYLNQVPGASPLGSGPPPAPNNGPTVDFINALTNGGAVHDNRYLDFGSHHQKLLVVKHGSTLTGFCGGMDISPGRNNWHDVHLKIEGQGAFDLHQTFVDRWTDHPLTQVPSRALVRTQLPPPPPRPPPGKPGTLKVQVVRTFGDGLKHSGLADLDIPTVLTAGTLTPIQEPVVGLLQQAPSTYAFASGGERGIFNLIVNSISAAQRFIYLEDQYLISEQPVAGGNSIAQRLAAKLTSADFQTLVILAARTESVNGELFQAWARRRAFVQQLKAAAPAKVAVCQYKVIPGQAVDTNVPTYVHSKTWIFDDEFCIVSSANCNRRGYTHDSEVGAGVFDPNNDGNRLYFAHALRMRLWMKHLNPSGDPSITERDLLDPVAASRFWRTPLPISAIEAYDEFGDTRSPPAAPNVNADRLLPLPLKSLTSQVLKNAQDEWDTLIDPDGA